MNENRLEAILRGLMDIYSPSGQEADLLDRIAGHLIDRGVPLIRQLVEGSRYNLVVLPARRQPLLAFIGHVDTVPAHDGQRFGYRRESDRVCGLGAAAMVETAPLGDSGITAGIRFHTCDPGYRLPENGPVVRALKRVYQDMGLAWNPQGFPSHCDANLLGAAETRTLILGPGSLETAHAPDEWVRFSQVRDAARCFEALGRLLAESAA